MAARAKDDAAPRETFVKFVNPMQSYFDKNLSALSNMVKVMPHNTLMLDTLEAYHDKHMAFPCRPTDIWITSFPKAGTTWAQELVWLLLKGLDHMDGDKPMMSRIPFFEWDALLHPKYDAAMALLPDDNVERRGMQWKILESDVNPRIIKSQLHRGLLPRGLKKTGSKIIYVMRDPRDVCISLYYHAVKLLDYKGDFENFVKIFLEDLYEFGPFWNNVLSYWNSRNSDNILFLRYEELQKDLPGNIKKVAAFLGVKVTAGKVAKMTERLSFEFMRNNPATNNELVMASLAGDSDIKFMRKGIIGDHMNHLSEAQILQFTKWTEKGLKGSDYPYYKY